MAEPDGSGGRPVMKRRRIDIINILKYGMVIVIIAYVAVLLARQGGDAPMKTVEENVITAMGMEGMSRAGTQELKRYYGLNDNDFEEVVLCIPDDVMGVNELLIVRLKDDSQAEAVMEAAQKRLDTQTESFEGYGAEQTKLLKSAVLDKRGSYVFMAVGKNAEKACRALKKSLK